MGNIDWPETALNVVCWAGGAAFIGLTDWRLGVGWALLSLFLSRPSGCEQCRR